MAMAQTISTDRQAAEYWKREAADHRALFLKEQQRAERLQQRVAQLEGELAKKQGELDAANENLQRAIRTVERAVAERDAACEVERETPYQFEGVTSW